MGGRPSEDRQHRNVALPMRWLRDESSYLCSHKSLLYACKMLANQSHQFREKATAGGEMPALTVLGWETVQTNTTKATALTHHGLWQI